MEDFKHINGFEDYLIFPTGKVYSLKRKKYLSLGINNKGYYQIGLWKSRNRYFKLVARLVAQAFIPNPGNKPEINHKDGNKANNDCSNLEWCTHSENMQHAYANGLNKRFSVAVYNYNPRKFLSTHLSLTDAAKIYGMHCQSIYHVLAGRRKQASGLTFERI